MITAQQKETIFQIVQIFETGRIDAKSYGTVTILKGDTGRLSVGRHQVTIASGNLYFLIKAYVEAGGKFASNLKPYLPVLKERRIICDNDKTLHNWLKLSGDDPIMQQTQDRFFDRVYWDTAVEQIEKLEFTKPLSYAVVYDSVVHGSWKLISNRVKDKVHFLKSVSERLWVETYVNERAKWISGHSNKLLRKTIYRMDAFRSLIADNRWELSLPLSVRGVTMREGATAASEITPVERASADEINSRTLYLKSPPMTGADVMMMQESLVKKKFLNVADGEFGPATDKAVRAYQASAGLTADGMVGSRTMAKLVG